MLLIFLQHVVPSRKGCGEEGGNKIMETKGETEKKRKTYQKRKKKIHARNKFIIRSSSTK